MKRPSRTILLVTLSLTLVAALGYYALMSFRDSFMFCTNLPDYSYHCYWNTNGYIEDLSGDQMTVYPHDIPLINALSTYSQWQDNQQATYGIIITPDGTLLVPVGTANASFQKFLDYQLQTMNPSTPDN